MNRDRSTPITIARVGNPGIPPCSGLGVGSSVDSGEGDGSGVGDGEGEVSGEGSGSETGSKIADITPPVESDNGLKPR